MSKPSPLIDARDNAAAEAWFAATDVLLDSITEASISNIEMFKLASPYERLIILRGQLHWLVDEFFKPMVDAAHPKQFTPEEKIAWQRTVAETSEKT